MRVTFRPPETAVEAATVEGGYGDTLLDAALAHGVEVPHACGGNCACTTCHVVVEEGWDHLSPMEEPESERLSTAPDRTSRSRLACQALLRGGPVVVRIVGSQDDWSPHAL